MLKGGGVLLCFSALLYSSTALSAVDISGKNRVEVGTWGELKKAVETAAKDTVIVLTKNITADADNPITGVRSTGVVIDGGGIYTITGKEGSSNGQFINFDSYDTTDLIIQNIKLEGFGNVNNYSALGGAIYNSYGTIGDIAGIFSSNYVQSNTTHYENNVGGGAIYNFVGSIGDISGDFSDNYVESYTSYGGAILNREGGSIGNITGDFSNNYVQGDNWTNGGAISNDYRASIKDITGNFTENYVKSDYYAQGGAIYGEYSSTIGNITGDFTGNYAQGSYVGGGAIYNGYDTFIGNITGDFTGNYAKSNSISEYDCAKGGAIYNNGTMTLVNSSFYNNYAQTTSTDKSKVQGGAIYTYTDLTIKADNGESIFSGNKIIWNGGEDSSAIYLGEYGANKLYLNARNNGLIEFNDKISAGYLSSIIISGDKTGNITFNNLLENIAPLEVLQTNVNIKSGAGTVSNTTVRDDGVFNVLENAKAEDSIVNSGGTLNVADMGEVNRTGVNDGGTLHVATGGLAQDTTVNSGGKLEAETQAKLNNMLANGGAILDIDNGAVLTGNIVIHADAEMGGSYDYSQIFKDEVTDKGSLTLVGGLNDAMTESSLINTTAEKKLNLTAGEYAIGDGAQAVEGWDMLTLKDTATVKLEGDIGLTGPNKKLIIENGSTLDLSGHSPSDYTITGSISNAGMMDFSHADDGADDITTIYGNYKAYTNAKMNINVNPSENVSDLLRVDGDVIGTTDVVLNIVGGDTKPTELIQFVDAPNDDTDTGAYFNIYRVYGSSFNWGAVYKDNGWYTGTTDLIPKGSESGYKDGTIGNLEDDENLEDDAVLPPNFPDTPSSGGNNQKTSVVGEAIAYMGLPSAGIEQTRDMSRNVANKVAATKLYNRTCHGFYDCEYNGSPLRNAWAAPVYSYSDVKAPYSYEAEISGFEGGFDIQSDAYNRLGVFGSYRQGSYDFDGNGDDYYSKVGADMDIDSYILGLYHRYDESKKWLMSQIFLGYQDVSLSSNDGVSSSTDGIEFGGAIEGGLIFNPLKDLTVEPSLRLAYTQINYDDATDNYGKTAKYDDVRNIEVEAGVKVEKTYLRKDGYAKIYVKPSIIQNIGSGDVTVTSLNKVDGLDNATLGRLEIGGSMSFDEKWSGYANTSYTFGSDYTNLGLNAGLNYAFQ